MNLSIKEIKPRLIPHLKLHHHLNLILNLTKTLSLILALNPNITLTHLRIKMSAFNPLAAGKIDLRLLQFAQKIVQMVFLT